MFAGDSGLISLRVMVHRCCLAVGFGVLGLSFGILGVRDRLIKMVWVDLLLRTDLQGEHGKSTNGYHEYQRRP